MKELEELRPALLGYEIETSREVSLSFPARRLGTYVVGKMGMGKTTTLLHLLRRDIGVGHGACVIDPQGEWIGDIFGLPELQDRADDVIYFDPSEKDFPVGLNLFECADPEDLDLVDRVVSQITRGVFQEIWGPMEDMPRLADVLRTACRTIILCQSLEKRDLRPTLRELPWLFDDKDYRHFMLEHIRNHYKKGDAIHVLNWWRAYEGKTARRQDEQVESTLNKVREFSQTWMVERVVGQNPGTIDFREAMDQGKIVLVDLAEGKVEREVAALIGSIVVSQINIAAKSRIDLISRGETLRPFHLLADEFQNFATYAFARIQNECRKFAVDITIAHQNRAGQLAEEKEVEASTLGATNWIVFQVIPGAKDAEVLAKGFDNTPSIPKEKLHPFAWEYLREGKHPNRKVADLVREISQHLQPNIVRRFKHGLDAERLAETEYISLDTFPSYSLASSCAQYISKALLSYMRSGPDEDDEPFVLTDREELLRVAWSGPYRWDSYGDELSLYDLSEEMEAELGSAGWDLEELKGRIEKLIEESADEADYGARSWARYYLSRRMSVHFCELVHRLGSLLAVEPVTIIPSQVANLPPRERLISDLVAERANELTHLPKYQAWIRLEENGQLEEYKLATAKPPNLIREEQIVEAIKQQSRKRYGTPIAEVQRKLAARGAVGKSSAEQEGVPYWSD